jgi:hypothetical protein
LPALRRAIVVSASAFPVAGIFQSSVALRCHRTLPKGTPLALRRPTFPETIKLCERSSKTRGPFGLRRQSAAATALSNNLRLRASSATRIYQSGVAAPLCHRTPNSSPLCHVYWKYCRVIFISTKRVESFWSSTLAERYGADHLPATALPMAYIECNPCAWDFVSTTAGNPRRT